MHRPCHVAEPAQPRKESLRLRLELVQREFPAVECTPDVLLQHAERRVERAAEIRVPAPELSDVREVALSEEAEQLQLRIDPRFEPAEDLQDQLLVEDDRRIRLLGRDPSRLRQLGSERREALERTKLDRPFVRLDGDAAADHVHELAYVTRIGECVELLAARHQLVRLVCSGVEADLDDLHSQLGLRFVQARLVEHARVCHFARLRPEPALRGDEVDQLGFSWNQKNPLGASVSRYGRSPIGGNRVRPNISSGTIPANCDRSSSTAWAERATLWTQSTMSSS